MRKEYDLAVIGGGSGGIGAALAAARLGVSTVLVDRGRALGGTAVRAGVSAWEPGAGGTGLPYDIYQRLRELPDAVGIMSIGRHLCLQTGDGPRYPGGETVIDPTRTYRDTLRRHGLRLSLAQEAEIREQWHGVVFEPDAYRMVVDAMLAETGCCDVVQPAICDAVAADDGCVEAVRLRDGRELRARYWVDATADANLCLAAGCEVLEGQESRDRFGEPSAPEVANDRINGATLIYRVAPVTEPAIEPLPAGIPAGCWWQSAFPVAQINHYPCGDLNVNMLPTMTGAELRQFGLHGSYDEAVRRVRAHWHDLQTRYEEFRGYRVCQVAEMLGVRESRRVVAEYMLTEVDLRAGLSGQSHGDLVAIADHALDRHGEGVPCAELTEPYGVPYRCLQPRGWRNLLVACRGAGFSSLAASSCRLSRTIMQLGQAAGTAVALALPGGTTLPQVRSEELRAALITQRVQLTWPATSDLWSSLI